MGRVDGARGSTHRHHRHAHRMQGLVAEGMANAAACQRQGHAQQPRSVKVIDGVVSGAVEVAAQQPVARIALFLHDTDHTAHRHAHQRERMAGQHQGTLDGLGHDFGGASGLEALDVGVVDRR